jgi:hypothetical protein
MEEGKQAAAARAPGFWTDAAPPYGAYRGRWSDGQENALGSGRLGGWSYATQGAFFDVRPPAEEGEGAHQGAPRRPPTWEEIARAELEAA